MELEALDAEIEMGGIEQFLEQLPEKAFQKQQGGPQMPLPQKNRRFFPLGINGAYPKYGIYR